LNRFFSLHYLLPFILAGLIGLHLVFLHESLSTNPLGIFFIIDKIPLYPYYFLKDLFGVLLFFVFFSIFLFFMPNLLGHPDNYIPANPMATPAHIVPE
jgi:quinol-cytochrome oxidoreductase complex cytochrome b subunit